MLGEKVDFCPPLGENGVDVPEGVEDGCPSLGENGVDVPEGVEDVCPPLGEIGVRDGFVVSCAAEDRPEDEGVGEGGVVDCAADGLAEGSDVDQGERGGAPEMLLGAGGVEVEGVEGAFWVADVVVEGAGGVTEAEPDDDGIGDPSPDPEVEGAGGVVEAEDDTDWLPGVDAGVDGPRPGEGLPLCWPWGGCLPWETDALGLDGDGVCCGETDAGSPPLELPVFCVSPSVDRPGGWNVPFGLLATSAV